MGEIFFLVEGGTVVPLPTKCCFCPLASLPCQRWHAPHKVFPKTDELEDAHHRAPHL